MSREELINSIKAIVGRKLVFPDEYCENVPEIGASRQVVGITKKYVYLATDCYITDAYEDNVGYIKVVHKIPVCGAIYGKIDSKVELDMLSKQDLYSIMKGLADFVIFSVRRTRELQEQLKEYQQYGEKLNLIQKYL